MSPPRLLQHPYHLTRKILHLPPLPLRTLQRPPANVPLSPSTSSTTSTSPRPSCSLPLLLRFYSRIDYTCCETAGGIWSVDCVCRVGGEAEEDSEGGGAGVVWELKQSVQRDLEVGTGQE
ncbi:hypothetical protein JCM11641_001610 [Rhodosporidiobolus odoratus]